MKEGIKKIFASKSQRFAFFCGCFLVGVALASVSDIRLPAKILFIIFSCLIFLCTGLTIFWAKIRRAKNHLISFCLPVCCGILICITVGVLRYALVFPENTPDQIQFYASKKVNLVGFISDEPDVRIDGVRYTINVQTVEASGKKNFVSGLVYAKYDLYPRFYYGDQLKLSCVLKLPGAIEDKNGGPPFRYDLYLARYHIFTTCDHPWLEKTGAGEGSRIFGTILGAKNYLADKITALWPEPDASFMAGLLYGYRGGLGKLNDLFSRTGVTHIVAISGFNITIIATIFINLCIYLCVPRQKAFWCISFGIVLFVVFTGASASVVRAGVMGIIALLAKYVGRISRIDNVLLLAAVIMTLQNPLVLMFDAGFQLSFISTLGLVYVGPIMKKMEKYFPEFLGIRENILSTLSAIVATTPLILFQFGRLSIVAPVVNVLILWIIPYIMIAGVAAVVGGIIFFPLGQLVAWFCWLGMEYAIFVVRWFAGLSWAAINIQVPAWGMVMMYCVLLCAVLKSRKNNLEIKKLYQMI